MTCCNIVLTLCRIIMTYCRINLIYVEIVDTLSDCYDIMQYYYDILSDYCGITSWCKRTFLHYHGNVTLSHCCCIMSDFLGKMSNIFFLYLWLSWHYGKLLFYFVTMLCTLVITSSKTVMWLCQDVLTLCRIDRHKFHYSISCNPYKVYPWHSHVLSNIASWCSSKFCYSILIVVIKDVTMQNLKYDVIHQWLFCNIIVTSGVDLQKINSRRDYYPYIANYSGMMICFVSTVLDMICNNEVSRNSRNNLKTVHKCNQQNHLKLFRSRIVWTMHEFDWRLRSRDHTNTGQKINQLFSRT